MKILQTVVFGLALSSIASAGIVANGSVAFADSVASYVGASLSAATSITLNSTNGIVTSDTGVPFLCPGGGADCTPNGSATLTTPITFSVPLGAYVNFITWGDGGLGAHATRYTFSVTGSTSSNALADDLTIQAVGTFHDALGFYNDSSASLLFSFTQAGGPTHAISGSGTVQTPAGFLLAPEPGTMLLMGGAMVGLGLLRRKKVKA